MSAHLSPPPPTTIQRRLKSCCSRLKFKPTVPRGLWGLAPASDVLWFQGSEGDLVQTAVKQTPDSTGSQSCQLAVTRLTGIIRGKYFTEVGKKELKIYRTVLTLWPQTSNPHFKTRVWQGSCFAFSINVIWLLIHSDYSWRKTRRNLWGKPLSFTQRGKKEFSDSISAAAD